MDRRGAKSGFSLVEALFASAILGSVLVPALLAFHSHLSALTRMRQTLDVELTLENLYAETEQALLFSAEAPNGNVDLAGPVRTVVTQPTETPSGNAKLHRYELSADNAAIRRSGLLYGVRRNSIAP